MGRVRIEVTKKINFEKMAEDWLDDTERIVEKKTMQMRQAVKYNIHAHDNIDTSTLISNLQAETKVSRGGYISYGEVSSDVSSHPEGHKGYAPIVERSYPNFIPALEEYTQLLFEELKSISI